MTELKIEMSTAASSTPNPDAEHETFLEEYARSMNRLLDANEGFTAIQELLAGSESRDVHLSDAGRAGLASIIRMLNKEFMDAYDSLPAAWKVRELLQGPRHE